MEETTIFWTMDYVVAIDVVRNNWDSMHILKVNIDHYIMYLVYNSHVIYYFGKKFIQIIQNKFNKTKTLPLS